MVNRVRFVFPSLAAIAITLLAGCQVDLSEEERNKIATAYAEMLLAKNMASGDSAAIRQAIDSTLKEHGFAGEAELKEKLDQVAMNPDHMREIFDSTQHILERVQQNNEPRDTLGKAKSFQKQDL